MTKTLDEFDVYHDEQQGDGKPLKDTLEQLIAVMSRRRWWILSTACGTALATVLVLSLLPNRYSSEATVLVIQQQVPERYVVSTSTTDISQALQGMMQEVLARNRLMSIIEDLDLYPREKKRLAPEALIERMRHDIEIQPLESNPERRNVNAFKISYISDTPQRAQEVTSRLTALFIDENVKTREHQATVTTTFLQEQVDAAMQQLTAQEERLRSYKMRYLGELPEQQSGNVQILASLSSQLENATAALNRAREQKAYLQSLLSGYRNLSARGNAPQARLSSALTPAEVVQNDLTRLRTERSALLARYTPDHPDIKKKEAEITKAEALLAQLGSQARASAENTPAQPARAERSESDAAIAQVNSQLEANRLEIENLSASAAELKASIERYQNRLNVTPVREQQLAGMLRDYDLLKQNYADLLGKRLQSQLAMNLEKHQEGQQFRLVDAPSLPTLPASPKRMRISLGGAAAGIFLGFVLAFFLDATDCVLHTEKETRSYIKGPLVVAVPMILTPSEERGRRWRAALGWCAACVWLLAVAAAEIYVYKRG